MEVDDRALLDDTALGDAAAFSSLLHRHLTSTLVLARSRVGSAEVAFDLVAETFAAVVVGAARQTTAEVGGWIADLCDHKLQESVTHGRVLAVSRRRLLLGAIVLADSDLEAIEELCADAPNSGDERLATSDRVVVPGGRRWRAQPAVARPAFQTLDAQLQDAVRHAPDVVGLQRRSLLRRRHA